MSNKYQFIGGEHGIWKVTKMGAYRGQPMEKPAAVGLNRITAPRSNDGSAL